DCGAGYGHRRLVHRCRRPFHGRGVSGLRQPHLSLPQRGRDATRGPGHPDDRGGIALVRLGLPLALLLAAASASAQVAANRTTLYLHPTDVTDARALWVNPAGLGRFQEASLHLDLTVGDPGAAGRLRQLTLGFNSRGFSFGYQRDVFDGGVRGHTYRLGFAGGPAGAAGGGAAAPPPRPPRPPPDPQRKNTTPKPP